MFASPKDQEADARKGRYPCPRCERALRVMKRGESFYPLKLPIFSTVFGAFRGYICEACGPIPFSELPSDAKVVKVMMCAATVFLFFVIGVGIYAGLTLP